MLGRRTRTGGNTAVPEPPGPPTPSPLAPHPEPPQPLQGRCAGYGKWSRGRLGGGGSLSDSRRRHHFQRDPDPPKLGGFKYSLGCKQTSVITGALGDRAPAADSGPRVSFGGSEPDSVRRCSEPSARHYSSALHSSVLLKVSLWSVHGRRTRAPSMDLTELGDFANMLCRFQGCGPVTPHLYVAWCVRRPGSRLLPSRGSQSAARRELFGGHSCPCGAQGCTWKPSEGCRSRTWSAERRRWEAGGQPRRESCGDTTSKHERGRDGGGPGLAMSCKNSACLGPAGNAGSREVPQAAAAPQRLGVTGPDVTEDRPP